MIDVFIMDMGGHDANVEYLRGRLPHAKILRWTDHLSCMRRAASQCRTRAFWLISSCCDYQDHDWLWDPVPWESHQIHCWSSGQQRFGDTFWVPRTHWLQQQDNINRIEDFQDVNFRSDSIPRLPWQTVIYRQDTLPQALEESGCHTPYVLFSDRDVSIMHDPWLWREQPVVAFDTGHAVSLVPRSAHGVVREQIYDYTWLEQRIEVQQRPLDVIFISNGESCAESHWMKLSSVMRGHENRLIRVDGVNGRRAAYQAAAEASETAWFFANSVSNSFA